MKTVLTYMSAAALVLVLFSGCVEQPFENVDNTYHTASAEFDYEIPVATMQRLRLTAINGPIDIVGVKGLGRVHVWGERQVSSDSYRDAKSYLDELKVGQVTGRDELVIRTIQPENTHGRDCSVVYHLRVPLNWAIDISNVNGDILLDGLQGDAHFDLVNGKIRIREFTGNLIAGITNGNADVQMQLPENGVCRLATVNGEIDLSIPKTTSARVDAALVAGKISLLNLSLNNQVSNKNTLTGTLADGKGQISLQTVNGDIILDGR
jgi:hypothetical protein